MNLCQIVWSVFDAKFASAVVGIPAILGPFLLYGKLPKAKQPAAPDELAGPVIRYNKKRTCVVRMLWVTAVLGVVAASSYYYAAAVALEYRDSRVGSQKGVGKSASTDQLPTAGPPADNYPCEERPGPLYLSVTLTTVFLFLGTFASVKALQFEKE